MIRYDSIKVLTFFTNLIIIFLASHTRLIAIIEWVPSHVRIDDLMRADNLTRAEGGLEAPLIHQGHLIRHSLIGKFLEKGLFLFVFLMI